MFEGKTGNPTRVKGNTSFPSLWCLLQAVLEVSCQDIHQKVEQPAQSRLPLRTSLWKKLVSFRMFSMALEDTSPPSQQYSKGIEKEMIRLGSTWATRDIGELPSRLHRLVTCHGCRANVSRQAAWDAT